MPRTVTPITPAEIVRSDGRRGLYDSLVFANVTRIAKYGRLSIFGCPDGGLFEVVSRGHGHHGQSPPWRWAPRALVSEPRPTSAASNSRRSTLFPVQIDGEVLYLAPDSGLIIDCAPHAVATVARTPT